MTRIPLAEAKASDLRAFATTVLGLEVGERDTKEQLLAKVRAVYTLPDFAPVAAEAPSPSPRRDGRRTQVKTRPDGSTVTEVCIRVMAATGPGGDRPVPVAVNGVQMLIPRGKEVWVPESYVEVLEHALAEEYDEYTDGLGGLGAPRVVQSYPFSYA